MYKSRRQKFSNLKIRMREERNVENPKINDTIFKIINQVDEGTKTIFLVHDV